MYITTALDLKKYVFEAYENKKSKNIENIKVRMLNLSNKTSIVRSQTVKAIRQRNRRIKRANCIRFNEPLKEFVRLKYPCVYKEYEMFYERLIADGTRKWKLTNTETFKQWEKTIQVEACRKKDNEPFEESINTDTTTELTPLEESINTDTTMELTPLEESINTDTTMELTPLEEPINMNTTMELTLPVNESPIEVQNVSTSLKLFVPQIRLEPCTINSSSSEVIDIQHGNDIINTLIQEEGLQEYLEEYNEVLPVKDETVVGIGELNDKSAIHPRELYEDPNGMREFQRVNDVINELIRDQHAIQEYQRDCDEGIDIDPLDELALDIEPFDFALEVEDLINYDY